MRQEYFERLKKMGLKPDQIWRQGCLEKLKGRTIVDVCYLTDGEQDDLGWSRKSLVLIFEDGNYIFASSDDEGNDAGALFTSWDDLPTIPVV